MEKAGPTLGPKGITGLRKETGRQRGSGKERRTLPRLRALPRLYLGRVGADNWAGR